MQKKGKTKARAKKKPMTKSRRVRQRNIRLILGCAVVLVLLAAAGRFAIRSAMDRQMQRRNSNTEQVGQSETQDSDGSQERWQKEGAPYIDVELLTPNEYSRPQLPLNEVKYIAIHYTANPGSGAMANRDYFENLADTRETKVSSHFVVGLDGEVVQCIPTSEMSYATNERNVDTISIETCHPDDSGEFTEATYHSVVKLTAWLCTRFGLTSEDVIRHYDVTGKICPKYYVENPDAWEQMKADIAAQIQEDYALQENL